MRHLVNCSPQPTPWPPSACRLRPGCQRGPWTLDPGARFSWWKLQLSDPAAGIWASYETVLPQFLPQARRGRRPPCPVTQDKTQHTRESPAEKRAGGRGLWPAGLGLLSLQGVAQASGHCWRDPRHEGSAKGSLSRAHTCSVPKPQSRAALVKPVPLGTR